MDRLAISLLRTAFVLPLFALPFTSQHVSARMPGDDQSLVVSAPESMTYLLSFWLVEFKRGQAMTTRIDTADSDAVARALVEGRAKLGAMSRRLSEEEVREFQARHARKPLEVRVALDGIAVYVHRDNPLRGLSIAEIDGIFSTTRKCGHGENIAWWDQLGLSEDWRLRQIELYGSHPSSSVRAVFADTALCGGTYKATLEFAPSANELLRLVAKNPASIAYGPANVDARAARQVRVLPVSAKDTSYVSPTRDSVAAGRYPLTRFLYLYATTEHDGRLSARQRAFLDSALSPHGQSFVGLNGYVPLPPELASEERAKLQ